MEDLTKFCANACAERMALEGDVQAERIIIDLIKQRDELLEALKCCLKKGSRWHSCDPVVVKANKAIANAEK